MFRMTRLYLMQIKIGKVYLVGAGPGDPGLITLKGARAIARADVIFYDYLANELLLKLAQPNAKKVFAGKKGSPQVLSQEAIQKGMIAEARQGHCVVRLKGGDPFIFGRGGEEAEALKLANIPFEVVPGVSSAIAVPAYAGIPLTHRDFTSEVVFVTGHEGGEMGYIPWEGLAKLRTIVFLMGRSNLRNNTQKLIAYGKPKETPAAMISWGTTPRQKKIVGTLGTLADMADQEEMEPPTITVIGPVVNLNQKLDWFESKPLFKKRILVTRSQEQASDISSRLEDCGGQVIEFPTLQITPPKNYSSLDDAIAGLKKYKWILFTSVNGVKFFWDRLRVAGKDVRSLAHLKIGAIGPATAEILKAYGLWVDLLPKTFQAEGMLKALKECGIAGAKVLIPRAKEGREVLIEGLKKMRCRVDVVEAYRTVIPQVDTADLEKIFFKTRPDWITFASSGTVENFVKILGKKNLNVFLKGVKIACIGPITRDTAVKLGIKVSVMPEESTIPALVEAMCKCSS